MKVGSVVPEKKPDVGFQECGNLSDSFLGKCETQEGFTGGGSSFISSGEILCWIFMKLYNHELNYILM